MDYNKKIYILTILLLIILGLSYSKNILAITPNDLYEPSSNQNDTTPPENATQIRLESVSDGITITWVDPTDRDFYQMLIYSLPLAPF